MARLSGVDGCRGGWVAVTTDTVSGGYSWQVFPNLMKLAAKTGSDIITLDVPIGLLDAGSRVCDLEARKLLGPGRASSVFPAPIRPSLAATSHAEASAARKVIEGKRISKQAWGIVPKIREVDDALRSDQELRSRVREVHPEVCFYFMAGCRPMKFNKKKPAGPGHEERRALLVEYLGSVIDEALRDRRSSLKDCAKDDLIDAFAALWTAVRIASNQATTIPSCPDRDRYGLPMEMVA